VTICALDQMKVMGMDIDDTSVAIQGFGNVGLYAAKLFAERGCKIVGISDVTGAYYNPKGLNVGDAIEHVAKHRNLEGFAGGERITNAELLAADCDVLVPARSRRSLTPKTPRRSRPSSSSRARTARPHRKRIASSASAASS